MARILFMLWDGGGNVPPVLLLARRLTARGHTVRILSNPSLRQRIAETGASFSPYRRAPAHDPRSPQTDAIRAWEGATSFEQASLIRDRLFFGPALALAEDLGEEMARFRPDAAAIDYVLFGGLVLAEAARLPTAVVMDSIFPLPHGGPRLGPFTYMFERLVARGLPTLNDLRLRFGLEPLYALREQYNRAQRIFQMTYAAFDPPGLELPAHVRHVGPQFDLPAAEKEDPGDGPPRVLVSLSTVFQDQGEVLHRLLEALGRLPVRALVTTGAALAGERFPSPPNVEVHAFVPHECVLPRAAAVVTHGGHGTVIRALAYGVPLLCLPFVQDQFDNARRVAAAGAGREAARSAPPEILCEELRALLEDPSYRDGARRMAERIRAEDDPLLAVRELEALARSAA